MFETIDWAAMFAFDTPILEIFLRGTFMYLALFILLRCVMKRQAGGLGINDLLVIVLIADAAQNGLSGDYRSIPDGILLVGVIFFWDYVIDWLTYHFEWVSKLVDPPPVLLIRAGKALHQNMRRELMSMEELMSQLREHGVDEVGKVKRACMEPDGKISVVAYERKPKVRKKETRAM